MDYRSSANYRGEHGRHSSSYKRKSDIDLGHHSKRPRTDDRSSRANGSSHNSNGTYQPLTYDDDTSRQRPDPLPELPPISAEYEKPVFTHPSATPADLQHSILGNYDRLEFLGDAYIEIISSRLIWSLYKDHGFSAARMSQVRESFVKNETLSEYSLGYGFDRRLKINEGSHAQRSTGKIKINGDVFEAYVAAIVLSDPKNGFETAEDWLTKLWEPKLKTVSTELPDENSKGELQKRIGFKGIVIAYFDERPANIDKRRGIETYYQGAYLTGWGYEKLLLGKGHGQSKKAAGMAAAKTALQNSLLMEELAAKKTKAKVEKDAEEQNAKDASRTG